jgi:glutathione S-transferase
MFAGSQASVAGAMTDAVTVFGAAYSVYVRSIRLALQEKGVAYDLVEVDIFADGGPPLDYLQRHPFGRIPAFQHGDFRLYETAAIMRYVDEAFAGPALQPVDPKPRARMSQILSLLDNYAYRPLVWDIYVERVSRPAAGTAPDEAKIAAAVEKARQCLAALSDLMATAPWLAGPDLSLADLHAAAIFAYFVQAPEAAALLEAQPRLRDWWQRIATRDSLKRTAPTP